MRKIKNVTTILIVLFLTISMTTSILLMPTTTAHSPIWTIDSYAFLQAGPNPVGVGQPVLIIMWVDGAMPGATVTNDIRRHDYTLTVTAPDGVEQSFNWPVVSDPISVQFISYTPTQVGTYNLSFSYPGQTYTWNSSSTERTWNGDVFTPARATSQLTVQQEPLPAPKDSYPLPTEYWTRPIEGQNTDWYSISSNWLGEPFILSGASIGGGTAGLYIARVQPDGIAPNSAHIMWSRPLQYGGIVGGNDTTIPGEMFYTGGSYQTRFANAIIMYGRLYYELPYGNSGVEAAGYA